MSPDASHEFDGDNRNSLDQYFIAEGEAQKMQEELAQMPQKIVPNSELAPNEIKETINIQTQGDKVINLVVNDPLTGKETEAIIQNEHFDAELLPAIQAPAEVQDLRLIKEAGAIDMADWVQTAVEVLPVITDENAI